MKIPVSRLEPEGADFEGEDPVSVFEWTDSPREVVHPAGPLRWRLHATLFGREFVATGRAEALFEGTCCRCGGPLSRVWGDDFAVSRQIGPEIAEVDLTSDLREAILLALPNNPTCSPECAGVCPRCGKRLAEGPCGCGPETPAGPWGALDNLFGG